MRKCIPLNFNWQYKKGFSERDAYNAIDESYETVNIPHIPTVLDVNYFTESDYAHTHCYRKHIEIQKDVEKKYWLCFEGVAHACDVFVNGTYVKSHYCGYTEFLVDITDVAVKGDNLISLKVESSESLNIPPFGGIIDFATFGGIYREVSLITTDTSYIETVFVKTLDIHEKRIEVAIKTKEAEDVQVSVEIFDMGGNCLVYKNGDADIECFFELSSSNCILWDIDNPVLYKAVVSLHKDEKVIDEYSLSFGIRTAEFKADGFYLNDKKIKLIGLNRHQSYPNVGYALPKQAQVDDANYLKHTLGLNIVRASHYPQSKHFLNQCDEIGLLVFEEMVGWQYVGDDEWKAHYLDGLEEMILTHKNHPSIILWGVRVNESGDDSGFYAQTNELARKLDDTRQTGGVRCSRESELFEDVYTYNDFSHNGKNSPIIDKAVATKDKDAAYLISEFNGHMFPTKSFDTEDRLLEHALRHARIVNATMGDEKVTGCIGWAYADYNTHQVFGGGDRICYHGALDIFRNEKLAAYFYMSQQDKYPVLMPSIQMDFGEKDHNFINEMYIFTNCDSVEIQKNGASLGIFYPDTENFPHLTHPPIHVKSIVKNLFIKKRYSDNETVEALLFLQSVIDDGGLHCISESTKSLIKDKEKREDIWHTYINGIMNFASGLKEQGGFCFIGYKDDKVVKTFEHIPFIKPVLSVTCSRTILHHSDTYDVERIVIKAMRSKEMVARYCFDPIQLIASGDIEIIGDTCVSLISGMRSVWIKTKKEGFGKLCVSSNRFSDSVLEFKIKN